MKQVPSGDFTTLADNYSKFRPAYSETVLEAITSLLPKASTLCNAVDVGAGTGIWTRMLASKSFGHLTAIEPNDNMRACGIQDSKHLPIEWRSGSGETTGLPDNSVDFVSMASSFHWVNFEKGIQEFHRVLRPDGLFVAIWNPRFIENSPLLMEIEQMIYEIKPDIQRVSSGKSDYVQNLSKRLSAVSEFKDLIYIEGFHDQAFTKEQYIGVWNSVNDIRAQLGEEAFSHFIEKINEKIKNYPTITCRYLTRAWIAKCNKG